MRIDAPLSRPRKQKQVRAQRRQAGLAWQKLPVCRVSRAALTGSFFALNRELFSASRAFFDNEQELLTRTIVAKRSEGHALIARRPALAAAIDST